MANLKAFRFPDLNPALGIEELCGMLMIIPRADAQT
jgi:hypothetical protein